MQCPYNFWLKLWKIVAHVACDNAVNRRKDHGCPFIRWYGAIHLSVGCYNMASIWCEWPFSINDLFQGILVKFMVPISFLTLNVLSKLNLFWIWVRYSLYIYIFRIKYKIKKFIILKHFIQTSWITSFPHINLYINTCISI